MDHPSRPAVIKETPSTKNSWSYVIETDGGETMHLRGLGAPSPGRVGEKGSVQYNVGGSYGLYFWLKEKK